MMRSALVLLVLALLPTGSHAAEDLPEDLPRKPLWSHGLAERDARFVPGTRIVSRGREWVAVVDRWWVPNPHRGAAPAPIRFGHASIDPYPAVAVTQFDGLVLYKDYTIGVQRSRVTGRFVATVGVVDPWNRSEVGLARPGVERPHGGRLLEAVYRTLDYGGNRAVVTERSIIVTESRKPLDELTRPQPLSQRTSNTLVAYARDTGKTRWGWNEMLPSEEVWKDAESKRKWLTDFHRHVRAVFRGPGDVAGTTLYTLVDGRDRLSKPAGVFIWAIDTRTGIVLFRTKIAGPDDVHQQIPTDATLTVRDGVAYVYASGVVAAVEVAAPGNIRWTGSYERSVRAAAVPAVARRRRGAWPQARQGRVVVATFAMHRPILTNGVLLVIAPDAKELVAYRADDGTRLWARPHSELKDTVHMVGIRDGVVVLAGTMVIGLDEKTGKTVWGPVALGETPYGRGFVGKRYAHVPTETGGIHRFEVATGKRAEPLRLDAGRLGNLNYSDGLLVAAGEDAVHCFGNRAELLQRSETLAAAADANSKTLLDFAMLRLADDPDAKARQAVRRPLRLAVERATDWRRRRYRAHAFENLVALARATNDLEPLAEAKRITDEAAYHAQIHLVRTQILRNLGRVAESDKELRIMARDFPEAQVVLEGKVLSVPEAAERLLPK